LQKNETTRQKSVHDYVVNTLNSSARVYEWTFLHDSDPWQEHMSVHARFCSAQTQEFSHCDFLLHEHFHDLDNLGDPDKDVAISCSSRFVARLYDQKSFASSHHNINKLLVKLATGRDACKGI
jgi:hypothetical protein